MSRSQPSHHVSDYLATAFKSLTALREGDSDPDVLHDLRTSLRRIQAYLQVIGDEAAAEAITKAVSESSRLRALQVFADYLGKIKVSKEDVRPIKRRIRKRQASLRDNETYPQIERQLKALSIPTSILPDDWLASRLSTLRRTHAEALRLLHASAQSAPRRKVLHDIRLRIKTVRYQEEWALGRTFAKPSMVRQLKQIQRVLGQYEDRAQFRKWAGDFEPRVQSRIQRGWKKSRERARTVVARLNQIIDDLAVQGLWLVETRRPGRRPKRVARRVIRQSA
jgi:CHAD domain-containing protein